MVSYRGNAMQSLTVARMFRQMLLLAGVAMIGGCSKAPTLAAVADTVYKNGKIYTVNEQSAWAEAVAIKDGKFLTVGTNADVEKAVGKDTVVIDLGGKFAMPGIHDLHSHPGYKYAYKIDGQLDFPPTATKVEIQAALKEHVAKHPEQKWIRGKQWAHALFPPEGKMPKEFIDAAVSDRAVVLVAESGHNVTANSMALKLAGITKNTPSPEGGVIDKDPKTGEPTGYLGEEAIALVGKFIPIPSNESWYLALKKALDEMRSVGFTSIVDAKTGRGALMGYRRLEGEGKLNIRVQATLNIHDYAVTVSDDEDSAKLINERKNFQSHLVNTNSVKVVADGSFLTFTCLLLEPYSNNSKTKGETAIGINAKAREQLLEYHKAGIQLHFHAHGDGTVHEVLNLIEQFQKDFPRPGLHHHIAHISLASAEDTQRFKELGIYADFSPPLYFPSVLSPSIDPIFGAERMQTTWYPIKEFVDAGVVTSFGSDWPLLFPGASPFPFMEAMVTRKDPWGQVPGQLGKPITLAQAVKVFTLGGAQVTMQEKENGTIEAGKYADMIVLDRNLFEVPVENIDSTQVLTTILEGKVVYSHPTR
jgi:predicted amidohydrolase YtcJ